MKIAIVVLTILSLGLGVGFLIQRQNAVQGVKAAEEGLTTYSNSWEQAKVKLDEAEKVASALETKLTLRTEALTAASNNLTKTSSDLSKATSDLAKTQADYNAAQAEVKKQQAQIALLETQRDDLTKKM